MKPQKGGRPTPADELMLLERRKIVAEQYLRGIPQYKIAQAVGVHHTQIGRDLAKIREEWRNSALMDFNERQAQELAKVDRIETVAWEAWDRSCQDGETLHVKTESDGAKDAQGKLIPTKTISEKTTKGQSGDPRFLERVAWCVEQRCKILGLVVLRQEHTFPGIMPVTPEQAAAAKQEVTAYRQQRLSSGDKHTANGHATNGSV